MFAQMKKHLTAHLPTFRIKGNMGTIIKLLRTDRACKSRLAILLSILIIFPLMIIIKIFLLLFSVSQLVPFSMLNGTKIF